ncbi:g3175 [Coccomyxa viridis]|uniref:G3175 protein n=1 Tax=Coccomyxa viridis TaxID=1274662 RepID=A0ABP1FU71_9CHLO
MDRDRRDELEICHGFNREKGSAKEETGSENPNESTESVGAGAPSDGPPETGASQSDEGPAKLLEGETDVEYMVRVFGPVYRELLEA